MSERPEPVTAACGAGRTADEASKESRGQLIWREIKGLFWVLLAVLAFHSFIAKPFYIPSESMMPNLLTGDRLVVTKYPYGWSYVSPTIPNPARSSATVLRARRTMEHHLALHEGPRARQAAGARRCGHRHSAGRNEDYIKRVIGLPGDTIEVRGRPADPQRQAGHGRSCARRR